MPGKARSTTGSRDFYRKLVESGGLSIENVAWVLASLSVSDLRSALWSIEEIRVMLDVSRSAAIAWLKREGIHHFRVAGKSYVSKLAVIDAIRRLEGGGDLDIAQRAHGLPVEAGAHFDTNRVREARGVRVRFPPPVLRPMPTRRSP